ncbi:unnamed protein product [Psylliodes chrysocephalus]|uniref:Titin-like n=1 Tax=Psylliodes chrysocephalus TaxID=3402493 RepID=A0A9P0GML3_9CUCU|nr:unnamed protein product [Psylliodes chrysocephala]
MLDLEYDSHFVFPNGFVDQNGIYYVNSYEPYPLMLYNPPTYYPEFSNSKSKRCSTGSLTESTSPNNEEATSQDLSGGEASNNVSDYSGHHSVYNMVYPGYYVNGVCPHQEIESGQNPSEQTRKLKKRRRRKTSRSQTNNQDESTECSEDEDLESVDPIVIESDKSTSSPTSKHTNCSTTEETIKINGYVEQKDEITEDLPQGPVVVPNVVVPQDDKGTIDLPKSQKYDLKPDAEEFVPRAYRTPEIPLSPVQFIKVPPNFVQIPLLPFNGQINPAFIPPGSIPINFIPPDPKLFPPNFVNFAPGHPKNQQISEKVDELKEVKTNDHNSKVCDINCNTAKDELAVKNEKITEKIVTNGKAIDIATIVSKLEEAAKEQEENDEDPTKTPDSENSPIKKPFRTNQKYRNHYKRTFYNSPRNSPQRQNGDVTNLNVTESNQIKYIGSDNHTEVPTDSKFVKNNYERFRKNWKNGNNKWQPNGAYRSPKQSPTHHSNIESKQSTTKHYSDTLKNVPITKEQDPELVRPVSAPSSPKVCPLVNKLPNQWISVSSRKKRKNKNVEESDASFEDTTTTTTTTTPGDDHPDEFESYDINLLVDVVPVEEIEETIKVEIIEEHVEQIINNIAQTESDNIQNNSLTPEIRLVTDIESELILKEESPTKEIKIEELENKQETEIAEKLIDEENKSSKKKSKKGTQKAITKRVIITDIDLSEKNEQVKTPMKKIVKKIDKPKEMQEIVPEEVQEPIVLPETVSEEPEEDKKKSKKKKKKTTKTSSLSSSSTTLSLAEDAYDLLLDTSLATETDKTNDEISVELDKMIQKGIYSSLEEKMKTLNLSETDGFFKSIFSKVPMTAKPEPVGFLKSPDFTKIPLVKSDPVSEDQNLESKKTNDELPASESSEIFLESPVVDVIQPEDPKSLYPITEAVKEWMCRTRETTPDVEIFKSPSTIYKEFCESDTNSDTEVWNSRNLSDELSASVEDDEITLFTTEEADKTEQGSNEDLLEYWEDLKTEEKKILNKEEIDKNEDGEELEVYESKYGNNEDFLKLQKEVQEKAKNINYPKHGNLPYRAICCNLM